MEVDVKQQATDGNGRHARTASALSSVGTPIPGTVRQQTLGSEFARSGVGLHTGLMVRVRVLPAPAGRGRYFVRMDKPGAPEVAATVATVHQTMLSTELVHGEADVRTVEHLLAALVAMGVDNARIELDGSEVPLLDGSAKEWTHAIAQAGIVPQTALRDTWALQAPLCVQDGDAFVIARPSSECRFTYGIDFDLPAIGNQWHSWSPDADTPFDTDIAPARTFGLAHQIETLRDRGLIKGGSLDNALVCGAEGWLNPPLRFLNEPVRHKLLDLIGDLSLLGTMPTAHFLAYKASHHLHIQLARLLQSHG